VCFYEPVEQEVERRALHFQDMAVQGVHLVSDELRLHEGCQGRHAELDPGRSE